MSPRPMPSTGRTNSLDNPGGGAGGGGWTSGVWTVADLSCPGCARPLKPAGGEKWCPLCIFEANIMCSVADEQLAAIHALEEYIRADERAHIITRLGQLGDEIHGAIDAAQKAIHRG